MLCYGCETASLALRGEHRLRFVVDVVQMKMLGFKWWHVTGGCRQLHTGQLHDVCCVLNVVILST